MFICKCALLAKAYLYKHNIAIIIPQTKKSIPIDYVDMWSSVCVCVCVYVCVCMFVCVCLCVCVIGASVVVG